MGTPPSKIQQKSLSLAMASASVPQAQKVLRWIKRYTRVAAMIAGMQTAEERNGCIDGIELPEEIESGGVMQTRPRYDVDIKATLTSPMSHGSDAKSGNATIFRRQQVLTDKGIAELPFYAGNALRGTLRDLLADHFLQEIGIAPRRDRPGIALWFFHILYAGGSLEENAKSTKALSARFGKAAGAVNANGIKEFRDMLPALSTLGCALGNRILPGRVKVADMRPQCVEWGTGSARAEELMTWEYLTRRDDHEGRSVEDGHTGMIAQSECLRPGVVLDGGIDIDRHAMELERSALGRGMALLQERGYLGAESRRGFGRAVMDLQGAPDPEQYDDFLRTEKTRIIAYLGSIGVMPISETIETYDGDEVTVSGGDDGIPY